MRKLLIVAVVLFAGMSLRGQTSDEIISRLNETLSQKEYLGSQFDFILDLPILGKMPTHVWENGNHVKMEMNVSGNKAVSWIDDKYTWIYDSKSNEVKIRNLEKDGKSSDKSAEDGMEMFGGITEGYDVSILNEDSETWYLQCKKKKSNTNKNDPKTMELAVSKSTYMPKYLRSKSKGIAISIENVQMGASPSEVIFDASMYPGIKIIDER